MVEQEEIKKEDKPITTLEEAKAERLLMTEQLDRRESIVVREEALAAEKVLGGTSEAGQPVEKPKEETAKEYADRVMAGAGNDE